ncbi:lysylphosphatidylglycerol synthase transmembrane domain-containing protein [Flammeovirga pacifica]|uniref:Lysylphosphatidylglycerol synthetase n=1 Tax=Flammeovirga pacifica TaxID=915059 RepID=A0A1S1YV97_FLAPC|nr:lysylphosphatidylglycerol synthase transmembrane domain-containing protein [Flammeovirga pacifica]OHX64946.1 hypothetical protein NH26_00580 [Flammeovirga pacifica]
MITVLKQHFTSKNLGFLFKTLMSVGMLLFLFFKVDFSVFKNLNWSIIPMLLLGLIITLSALALMTCRWKVLTNTLNIKADFKNLYVYYLKGSFFNIFLPGAIGGDIIRTRELITKYQANTKTATIITVVERVAGLYTLGILGSLGIIFIELPTGLNFKTVLPAYVWYTLPTLAFACIPVVKWIINKKVNIGYKTILPTLILSLLGQMGDILIAFSFVLFFDLPIGFEQFLVIMPVVYIATVLPISLGGLGVREGTVVGILAFYGVDTSLAIMISFLMYFVKVLLAFVGWLFYISTK